MDRSAKMRRLASIARLYYEEERTQSEIAELFGVSRPMVSRLLKEAREWGIVTIHIHDPEMPECEADGQQVGACSQLTASERICREYGLEHCILAESDGGDLTANQATARAAIDWLEHLAESGKSRFGLGWGHIIGELVSQAENSPRLLNLGQSICPLVGNGGAGLKNYHSNELVRVISEHSQAEPEFIYTPAFITSEQELKLIKDLTSYRQIRQAWEELDIALVNIGNFPSVPDFASKARYGDILMRERAVGRILNYFVSEDGYVIHSDTDYAVQIPLELLRKVPHVVGICSANTNPRALSAALKTGCFRYLIAPERVAKKLHM